MLGVLEIPCKRKFALSAAALLLFSIVSSSAADEKKPLLPYTTISGRVTYNGSGLAGVALNGCAGFSGDDRFRWNVLYLPGFGRHELHAHAVSRRLHLYAGIRIAQQHHHSTDGELFRDAELELLHYQRHGDLLRLHHEL